MPRDATQYEGRDQRRRKRARELANCLPEADSREEDNDPSSAEEAEIINDSSPDERREDTPPLFSTIDTA